MKDKKQNFCIDCNKNIGIDAQRCKTCCNKTKAKPKLISFCLICNKQNGKNGVKYCSKECYYQSRRGKPANFTEEHKAKLILASKNRIWTKDMRKKTGEKSKGRKWPEQSKIEKSNKLKYEYLTGQRIHPRKGKTKENDEAIAKWCEGNLKWRQNGGKTPEVSSNFGFFAFDVGHYVRSMWEANVARLLKFNNLEYKYEPISFSLSNNIIYIPDFYIEDLDLWIEVKGTRSDRNNFEKTDKFIYETGKKVLKIGRENYVMLRKIYRDIIPNWDFKTDKKGNILPYRSGLKY